jgi:cytochrome c-type biogenesis protein CcmE
VKKASILILVFIATAIGFVVASFGKFSTYETFASAAEKPASVFKVIGYLDTLQKQQYDPKIDANTFTFFARDKKGATHKVIFNGTKPQDFERSEQLVMTGSMRDDVFHCSSMQMKCPSKYQNDKIAVGNKPAANSY